MESLEIARLLREAFPHEVLDIREHRGQVAVLLRHERILDVLVYARQHLDLMHLRSLCGVDNSRRHEEGLGAFEVVAQGFLGAEFVVDDQNGGQAAEGD